MTTDQIIATVAAGAGVAAAAVAGWQATIARAQARDARAGAQAAETAADTARRQAAAAEQQAQIAEEHVTVVKDQVRAAEEQVALMRRQLDAQDADRREARGPQFSIEYRGAYRGSDRIKHFEVIQDSGPALTRVLVQVEGENVLGIPVQDQAGGCIPVQDQAGGSSSLRPELQIDRIAQGSVFSVPVAMVPIRVTTPVHFTLECQGQDGTDVWSRSMVAHAQPPARATFF
ncbi:hypothetical protein ACFVUN_36030 [Kitasatospora griseola]|uniref:hypothetical protein n=1 Tax=Kitasatospora griseola TaxID=2064 RepID=UPI0036DC50F6